MKASYTASHSSPQGHSRRRRGCGNFDRGGLQDGNKARASAGGAESKPKRGGTLTYAGGAAGSYDTSGSGSTLRFSHRLGRRGTRSSTSGWSPTTSQLRNRARAGAEMGAAVADGVHVHAAARREMAEQAAGQRPGADRGRHRLQPPAGADRIDPKGSTAARC